MKLVLILVCGLAAGLARGEVTPSVDHQVEKNSTAPKASDSSPLKQPKKTTEIQGKKFTFGGIFVKCAKTDKPLQLVNPAAPKKYGNGEDAVHLDPITGKPAGWKLFSISW